MKRFALVGCAVVCLALYAAPAHASWAALTYSGYQPWWNVFAHRNKCQTPEEERLQKFWHDYYSALKNYYCDLDHIDWVAYYKNHGYQINGGCCNPCGGPPGCGRINYAPVVVAPNLMWAVPQGAFNGPPCGPAGMPACGGPGCGGPLPGPGGY